MAKRSKQIQKQYCNTFNKDFKNGPHRKKNLSKKKERESKGWFPGAGSLIGGRRGKGDGELFKGHRVTILQSTRDLFHNPVNILYTTELFI